jgi:hypothetical protein
MAWNNLLLHLESTDVFINGSFRKANWKRFGTMDKRRMTLQQSITNYEVLECGLGNLF